ncbi:hypothetical protein PPERSA_04351 [Pseudocohnilembus persalinus]|uniref:Uncharacterized protein n=1 Tax=Pseudocohnilembus persalinus TaxID=266149 RepID=A0A0V0QR99_PSEPJ|nr:hypothetical protein PPERSA_04351 [Pseudocohnilembus persalinus]|eukprot:KRX04536.1 hypothetical protein PPERSA_04351 [Pseudocohnilembus persalinus]
MTNVGMELLKEIKEENQEDEIKKNQQKKQQQQQKMTQLNESSILVKELLQDHNQTVDKSLSEKILLAGLPNTERNKKLLKAEFTKGMRPQIQQNKYLQQQINKYTDKIMKPLFVSKKYQQNNNNNYNKNNSNSQSNLRQIGSSIVLGYPGTSTNSSLAQSRPNTNDSLMFQSSSVADDYYALEKYNQVLSTESKLDSIYQRYNQHNENYKRLCKNIKQKFKSNKQEEEDYLNSQPKKIEQEIGKEEHEQIKEIIKFQSQYNNRKKERLYEYLGRHYQEPWTQFKPPKLTQKSLQNHLRHEKYQSQNNRLKMIYEF